MKSSEIAYLLPGIYQRTLYSGNPLDALLQVMEALHAPSEDVLANLDAYFDPYRTPDAFVTFLARWVDLDQLLIESPEERAATDTSPLPSGLGRLRELIAAAAFLSQWRGTKKGLQRFLETATGMDGFEIDERDASGTPQPFYVRILAPQKAQRYRVLLERIIDLEKPAYVKCDLVFKS